MAHEYLGAPSHTTVPSFIQAFEAIELDVGDTPTRAHAAAIEEQRYVFVRSAASVAPEEVEDIGASAIEVTVLWGTNVLHVSHLSPPRAFSVGHGDVGSVDFVVPAELAPFARAEIVTLDGATARVVAPRGTDLRAPNGEALGAVEDAEGRRSAVLADGVIAEVRFGELSFRVAVVTAGKRLPRAVGADARELGSSFLATFAAVATVLGTLAYYTPALGSTLDEGLDKDRLATMLAILNANAEREEKVTPSQGESSSTQGGGTPGTAAKGPEGKMGRPDKPSTQKRFAIAGSGEVVLSRTQLIADAMN
ncbi:MAG TPA: hypothetical protein VMS65_18205, partial [Polyangiaceae bacterium]|nr:hypothetical protein [Polyangiaceae bacterium]